MFSKEICLRANSWENDIVELILLLSVLSSNFNNSHPETGKKHASGRKSARLAYLQGTEDQLWLLGDMHQVKNPAEWRPLGSTRRKWEDNIKMGVT